MNPAILERFEKKRTIALLKTRVPACTPLTITAKGQVTFRQSLLKHLGVRPGDPIEVEQMPDGQLAVRAAHSGE